MNIRSNEMKPWYWVITYFSKKDNIRILQTNHGFIFAHDIDEAQSILHENWPDDNSFVIIESHIRQIEVNCNNYCNFGNIQIELQKEFNNELNDHVSNEKPVWKTWEGWRGNHDQRIEEATCSKCGYVHPTVKGSLSKLGTVCPSCKSIITEVEYNNHQREYVI